jgi:hypothetical protein
MVALIMSMMARLKELELENARLNKIHAEERLKDEILNEALTKKWQGHLAVMSWPDGW